MDKFLIDMKMPSFLSKWRWMSFLEDTRNSFSKIDSYQYPIPSKFINNECLLENKSSPIQVNLFTFAFQTKKIRQARVACVEAGSIASVMNFVVSPYPNYELPFFGADFVTLPNGHLIAIDFQPVLQSNHKHINKMWKRLKPIHDRWKNLVPIGGPIPDDAKPYFSPGFLWSRIPLGLEGDHLISDVIAPAYNDYLSLYIDLLVECLEVDSVHAQDILIGQKKYMQYRAKKDPARGMLTRFFGKDWTESYINQVLFNL